MKNFTKEKLNHRAQEKLRVRFLRLCFHDIDGTVKKTVESLLVNNKALDNEINV